MSNCFVLCEKHKKVRNSAQTNEALNIQLTLGLKQTGHLEGERLTPEDKTNYLKINHNSNDSPIGYILTRYYEPLRDITKEEEGRRANQLKWLGTIHVQRSVPQISVDGARIAKRRVFPMLAVVSKFHTAFHSLGTSHSPSSNFAVQRSARHQRDLRAWSRGSTQFALLPSSSMFLLANINIRQHPCLNRTFNSEDQSKSQNCSLVQKLIIEMAPIIVTNAFLIFPLFLVSVRKLAL